MKGLTAAWLAYLGIATYKWEKAHRGVLPPPGIYLGTSIVFGGLGLVGTAAPAFASTFAWALVIAAGVTGAYDQIEQVPIPASLNNLASLPLGGGPRGTHNPNLPSLLTGGATTGKLKDPTAGMAPVVAQPYGPTGTSNSGLAGLLSP